MKLRYIILIISLIFSNIAITLQTNSGMAYAKLGTPVTSIQQFGKGATAGGWSSFDNFPRMVGDFDGDNQTDIIGFSNNKVQVSYSKYIYFHLFLYNNIFY